MTQLDATLARPGRTYTGTAVRGTPSGRLSKRRMRTAAAVVLGPLLSLLGALVLWSMVSYWVLSPERRFLLPPPVDVLKNSLMDWTHLKPMLEALAVTAQVAVVGFLVAVVVGVGTGVLMSQAKWIERIIYPYAVVIQVIPILAIVPLIGLWFGYGMMSRTLVCVLIAAFPIITNTHFGIRSVDRGLHELLPSLVHHGGTGWSNSNCERHFRRSSPACAPPQDSSWSARSSETCSSPRGSRGSAHCSTSIADACSPTT